MNRKELQDLTRLRLKEAQLLLQTGCPDGAYYLAGYAAECGIKACIAKLTNRHEFPDKKRANESHHHKLDELVGVAGLKPVLVATERQDSVFSANWGIVQKWSEVSRYERHSSTEAEALIDALQDRRHGFIQWLKRYW